MPASLFDHGDLKWVHIPGPDNEAEYSVDYSLALLGADLAVGSLDMLMKVPPGRHCTRHRHIGRTTTFVLAGEHHLYEFDEAGNVHHEVRRVGGHGLSPGGHVHIEGGGSVGCIVLFSLQAIDGHLFDLLDPSGEILQKVTVESLALGLS